MAAICQIVAASEDRIVCMTTHGWAGTVGRHSGALPKSDPCRRRPGRPCSWLGPELQPHFLERSIAPRRVRHGGEECVELVPVVQEWVGAARLDVRTAVVDDIHWYVDSAEHF